MDLRDSYRALIKRGTLGAVVVFALSSCGASTPPSGRSSFPQVDVARQAANWLAGQVNGAGFVPIASGSRPDLSATAQTALALAVGDERAVADREVTYLERNATAYIEAEGTVGPGQLGILVLDAEASGANPRNFGGIDLVAELLATEQGSGPNAGAFGTDAQVAGQDAGTYDQGIALSALAAAGVRRTPEVQAAVRWLVDQQCPGGGWSLPDVADNPCNAPAPDGGPDTNSTAMAIQGLAAQGGLDSTVKNKALRFLRSAERSDGGWSYAPQTQNSAAFTDPDSTALVIQALIAAQVSPTSPDFARGLADPVRALLGFRLSSGQGAGAFFYPPGPGSPNIISTYQAIPALMGVTLSQVSPSGSSS